MYRLLLVLIATALLATAACAQEPGADLLRQYWDAWSTLDPAKAAHFYDKTPTNLYFDLAPLKYNGWEQYKQGVVALLADFQSGKVTLNDDVVVQRTGNLAWTASTAHMDMVNKDGSKSLMDVRHTAIWKKKGKDWLIVHEHVSAPLPPAPAK